MNDLSNFFIFIGRFEQTSWGIQQRWDARATLGKKSLWTCRTSFQSSLFCRSEIAQINTLRWHRIQGLSRGFPRSEDRCAWRRRSSEISIGENQVEKLYREIQQTGRLQLRQLVKNRLIGKLLTRELDICCTSSVSRDRMCSKQGRMQRRHQKEICWQTNPWNKLNKKCFYTVFNCLLELSWVK